MKKCQKLSEPVTLQTYRQVKPKATWNEMQNDPFHSGQQAYRDVKNVLVKGQRCLCAYCEIRIADGLDLESIEAKKHEQRVEHFHPKEDNTGSVNWALYWPNLWAVCHGGSQRPPVGIPSEPKVFLEPLPDNLSCDAFKDHQIKTGKLPLNPEGWILSPDEVQSFPLLFQFAPEGTPEPHSANCGTIEFPNNKHSDTKTLVAETIRHLNLGCVRLNRNRAIARAQLENQIKKARQNAPHAAPATVIRNLVQRLFPSNTNSPWPEFFSLIRWRLDEAVETHLQAISYRG